MKIMMVKMMLRQIEKDLVDYDVILHLIEIFSLTFSLSN